MRHILETAAARAAADGVGLSLRAEQLLHVMTFNPELLTWIEVDVPRPLRGR
jgi:hypothetical protein